MPALLAEGRWKTWRAGRHRRPARLLHGLGRTDEAERLVRDARVRAHRSAWVAGAGPLALDLAVLLLSREDGGPEIPLLVSQAIPVIRDTPPSTGSGRRRDHADEEPETVLEELAGAVRDDRFTLELLEKARQEEAVSVPRVRRCLRRSCNFKMSAFRCGPRAS